MKNEQNATNMYFFLKKYIHKYYKNTQIVKPLNTQHEKIRKKKHATNKKGHAFEKKVKFCGRKLEAIKKEDTVKGGRWRPSIINIFSINVRERKKS